MPSAKKNEKTKGTSVVASSRRSSGPATKTALKSTAAGSVSGKTLPAKSAVGATAAKAAAAAVDAPAAKKSAAKTAKTAAKTTTKAPVATTAPQIDAPTPAPAEAPKAAGKMAAGKVVAKAAKSAPVSETAAPAAKPSAGKPGVAKSAPAPVKAPAATAAKAAPPAPAPAATRARSGDSPFPAAAPATAGKSSSTSTGEDKKLAKRNEPSVMTAPVAAEKTITETKAAVKPAPAPAKAKPAGQKHGFKLNEFIVYPAHGVGQIVGMETQEVAGFSLELFVVSFIKDKMILKVPTSKVANVGMRKLAEANVVDKALATLSGRARVKRTMWSRRAQEYEAKINSGDLITIAEVVRDLYRSDTQPEQSYSERQLYEAALDRMAREVAAVRKLIDSEALKLIESFLQKGPRRGQKSEADVADEADEEDVDRAA